MKTITFFSYKGGVGRTLAAVNFAVYASRQGQTTAILDFDLEAPGVSAKFAELQSQDDTEPGLLDYILEYQEHGRIWPSIKPLAREVSVAEGSAPLWVIPAGRSFHIDYYERLRELAWAKLFSAERDGVAFFQGMLDALATELKLDLLVVDSRTGITDISGLCTQQLADEVVLLSSLAAESLKMTAPLLSFIHKSPVARALGKARTTKVVLSRLPMPTDLPTYQERMAAQLGVPERDLFFLFSSKHLEAEEFIALREPTRDEELTLAYTRLFQGLDVLIGQRKVEEELRAVVEDLLSDPPEESERRLRELAALYPHPEVYRALARFYQLTQQHEQIPDACWRVLAVVPGDREMEQLLLTNYLRPRRQVVLTEPRERERFWKLYRSIAGRGELQKLRPQHLLTLGRLFSDSRLWAECQEVMEPLLQSSEPPLRRSARILASLAYAQQKKHQRALETARELPMEDVPDLVVPLLDADEATRGVEDTWEGILRSLRTSPERLNLALKLMQQGESRSRRQAELLNAVNNSAWWRDPATRPSLPNGSGVAVNEQGVLVADEDDEIPF